MLKSEELYCIINSSRDNKPTSHIYFEKKFDSKELDWRFIYTLPRKVTTNTYLSSFLCKVLNNILYMNEKRFVFGLSTTSSYSFCNSFGKNITHLFCDCTIRRYIYEKLRLNLKNDLTLFQITPEAAIFDFLELDCQSYLIPNHILLILKLYVYKSRKNKF